MFQMNPLEILTLVLMLLVVAGCIAVVVVAVRWLRSIGLQLERDRADRLERERQDAERDAADAARRAEDQDAQRELVKTQTEAAAAQAQLMKEQAALANAEVALASAKVARANKQAEAARERAELSRVQAQAEAERARAAREQAHAETERSQAEIQRAEVEEDLARVEGRRAEAATRREEAEAGRAAAEAKAAEADARHADALADAVRDEAAAGRAGSAGLGDSQDESGVPADGRAVNPFGSSGGFLPAHGFGSGWNGPLSDLSDVLGTWGGKAGKDTPKNGFPIDPRLLNLLPEDARKLLGGLKRPEDAEALFDWLRKRFGEPPQGRRRGPDGSRRPAGFQPHQPDDTGTEDTGGSGSGDVLDGDEGGDEGGRGSATPPAGIWGSDEADADRSDAGKHVNGTVSPAGTGRSDGSSRSDRPDRSRQQGDADSSDRTGPEHGQGAGDGVRRRGDSSSEDADDQVTDAGAGRANGSSWGAPWTGGIDVGALIEEALRERGTRRRGGDPAPGEDSDDAPGGGSDDAVGEDSDHAAGDPPKHEDGESSSRDDGPGGTDESGGTTDTSPDGEDD